MLNRIVKIFGGDPNKREIDKFSDIVSQINQLEAAYEALSWEELSGKTSEFRLRLAQGETLADLLVEAFATVREASKRTIGLRHYDVQLIGGMTLHQGKIAEMRTGEGKTLVATLPLYLNALALNPLWVEKAGRTWGENPNGWQFIPLGEISVGRGTHLITVNDYLARRDARWMAPIYSRLGLTLGVLQMAARTESGKKAYLVDLEKESPHEDQHQLRMVNRREAYAADITYGTNSEFGFDFLRDNMTMRMDERVQRGHVFAIIDEVDNVLIDEARTPLIISGPSSDNSEWYLRMSQVVKQLRPEDYEVSERDRTVTLTEIGEGRVEELLGIALRDPERPEDVTPEQARLLGFLEQALRAQHLFRRNKDYLVQAGKVVIVDEFTGRLMPGRRWSDGLHQAVEAKEGVRVQAENVTYATITIQNYFRMYEKLAGMTGTAVTESEEFSKIYELDVLAIPTNLDYEAGRSDKKLISLESKDEAGYKFTYYTYEDLPDKQPIYYKRKDYPDVIYRTLEAKLRALTREILTNYSLGRPTLVGTTSVELSENISSRLRAEPMRRLAIVLILRDAWFMKNKREEDGRQVPELNFLNQPIDELQLAEIRRLARELDISANPDEDENLSRLLGILSLDSKDAERLSAALKGGLNHQVLNAKKHTEESLIIAKAGMLGAVTIATNMAGRGVDIKLGGELPVDVMPPIKDYLRDKVQPGENIYRLSDLVIFDRLLAHLGSQFGVSTAEFETLRQQDPLRYPITLRKMFVERANLGDALLKSAALDEWNLLSYALSKSDVSLKLGEIIIQFWQQAEQEVRVRSLGGLHVIGSERHEARRIDNQLRGRSGRQGDPGSSRFYLSMEDPLMRIFGGEQADAMLQRLKVDDSVPLEVGLVGRMIEQAQTRVEGANFDSRKHLLEYDDVLNSQRARIYSQRDVIFSKNDLSEDVGEMLSIEVNQRVPDALQDPDGPWKLLAWLDQIQPTLTIGSLLIPSYTLKVLLDELEDQRTTKEHLKTALAQVAANALISEQNHLLRSINALLDSTLDRLEETRQERLEIIDNYFDELSDSEEKASPPVRKIIDEISELVHIPVSLPREIERQVQNEPTRLRPLVQQELESALLGQTLKRILGSIERRLDQEFDLNLSEVEFGAWEPVYTQIQEAIAETFSRMQERLLGQNGAGAGLILRDLETHLSHLPDEITRGQLAGLLQQLPHGSLTTFDRKTHRRVRQRTTYLTYTYYAAHLFEGQQPQEITSDVLEHLTLAKSTIQFAWGAAEISRLANTSLSSLAENSIDGFIAVLGEEPYHQISSIPLQNLAGQERQIVIQELGRQALTEVYRELLLRVISELWVEYLTQVEALRISIGLEAYGQRDPLVQYKSRASEMFQTLMDNIRLGVVTRMFTFRPRDLSSAQVSLANKQALPAQVEVEEVQAAEESQKSGSRSRGRRKRR